VSAAWAAQATSVLLAGLLTGHELATWAVVHPALYGLPRAAHIQAEAELVRRYRYTMPVAMVAVITACVALMRTVRRTSAARAQLALAASGCYAAMVAVTLMGNVPINLRTLAADPTTPPADWLAMRHRWDRLHVVRVVLDLTGFACVILAVLSPGSKRGGYAR
jgi:uncharacterized membrane protein